MIFSYPKLLNGKPSYDHEEALKRLYASHGRRNIKNHQPKTEESGKSEQKRDVESFVVESAAPVAGKPDGIPALAIPVDVDLSGGDNPSLSDSTGRNIVEFPRNGRPKPSFKFVAPDDDDHEEIHQWQETFIEPDVCYEPTPEEIDAAVALM
ncbi:hypothetical protein D3C81_1593060 [compost metagenome]